MNKKLLKELKILIPVLIGLFLVFAGILALTQEGDKDIREETDTDAGLSGEGEDGEPAEGEEIPQWIPPAPPRWFRSNAGGMALEEIPSRLTAIRNEYALVIDYISPPELDLFLRPYYREEYDIEIRILYQQGEEIRKQYLFRDTEGNTRLDAVFRLVEREVPETDTENDAGTADTAGVDLAGGPALSAEAVTPDAPSPGSGDETGAEGPEAGTKTAPPDADGQVTVGFIEIYNDDFQIEKDYRFTDEGEEIMTAYFYNQNTLVRAETGQRLQGTVSDYQKIYTDTFRYNRSFFLRNIERVFHGTVQVEPVFLSFPGRIMELAHDTNFLKEKLSPNTDFIQGLFAGEDYRIVYDTDGRGRILAQTMYDKDDEIVWVIKNAWIGDRIASVTKTEGDDVKITEYEYNGAGDRIVHRDINNGILERQILIEGNKETEELFMDGVVVLRAFWEDGRKISEERVRRR